MLLTSGFPKSGTHALVKACQLLGQPCDVQHLPFDAELQGPHVFVKRDPRNIVPSWVRMQGNRVTPGTVMAAFRRFAVASLPFEMFAYEGWLSHPGTLVVRYEDLVANDAEMRRIADYLGVPYIADAWEDLPGFTRTWFADHSDCLQTWTPEVAAMWAAEGGTDLLERWGYA